MKFWFCIAFFKSNDVICVLKHILFWCLHLWEAFPCNFSPPSCSVFGLYLRSATVLTNVAQIVRNTMLQTIYKALQMKHTRKETQEEKFCIRIGWTMVRHTLLQWTRSIQIKQRRKKIQEKNHQMHPWWRMVTLIILMTWGRCCKNKTKRDKIVLCTIKTIENTLKRKVKIVAAHKFHKTMLIIL